MREFKFRAWDIKSKQMNYTMCLEGMFAHYDNSQFDLMEWTGLKDKNGKEIFEADIVRGYAKNDKSSFIASVTWDQDEIVGYRTKFVSEGLSFNYYLCGWYEYEVLGNIYENADLIDIKQD